MSATVNIVSCGACGHDHFDLEVFKNDSFFLEFYAKCPETNARVFVASVPPAPEEMTLADVAEEWGFHFGVKV